MAITDDRRRITADEVAERVDALLPEIRDRVGEIEAGRHLPADLAASLREAGWFRICVPQDLGGCGADMSLTTEIIERVARVDAAVAWNMSIANESSNFLATFPEKTARAFYAVNPDAIVAGSTIPGGTAQPVAGGYQVNGRWPWASGNANADWLLANCTVVDDGVPRPGPIPGMPLQLLMLVDEGVATRLDTWHSSGLRGSGSGDFTLTDAFVPEERTSQGIVAPPNAALSNALPAYISGGLHFAAINVGIAAGALDDLIDLATRQSKKRFLATLPMAEQPVFQRDLGQAATTLAAARAALRAQVRSLLDAAPTLPRGIPLLLHPISKATSAMSTWVARTAASVVDVAYLTAGGTSVFESSPLQRRFRDAHTVTQHVGLAEAMFTRYGADFVGINVLL